MRRGLPVAQPTNWSMRTPANGDKVPVAGDKVIIGRDKDVILDVTPPALGGLSIDGNLTFASNADLEAYHRVDHAARRTGRSSASQPPHATIRYDDPPIKGPKGEDVMAGMEYRGIIILANLNLHGDRINTWEIKLASTAKAGSESRFRLECRPGWRVGDEIVLASMTSIPGRPSSAPSRRHIVQQHHALPEAGEHALRQDHLRRGTSAAKWVCSTPTSSRCVGRMRRQLSSAAFMAMPCSKTSVC